MKLSVDDNYTQFIQVVEFNVLSIFLHMDLSVSHDEGVMESPSILVDSCISPCCSACISIM